MKSRCALGVAAALITTPLVGLPAWGAVRFSSGSGLHSGRLFLQRPRAYVQQHRR
jgi:hypothetical protein